MHLFSRGFLVAMAIGLLVGCSQDPVEESSHVAVNDASALAVSLATVTRQIMATEVVASGQVAAWEDMPLGVELNGVRVAEVKVEVGQEVKAGDTLLTLDDRVLKSDLAQTRAPLSEARAGLSLAQANLERGNTLRERSLLSAADFDQLRAAQVQAEARVESAKAQVDAAALRLSFTVLKAPDAGVISSRNTKAGEVVSSGQPLLGLIRQNRLEWQAQIAEGDLAKVKPGHVVIVRSPTGTPVHAVVRAVSPGLDQRTRTGLLHADLPEPGELRAGMVMEGRIVVGETPMLTLPVASVVRRDGYAYAYTVDEAQRVSRHRIEVGRIRDNVIELMSGLDEGARVVERGAGFLSDGDRVRVVATP